MAKKNEIVAPTPLAVVTVEHVQGLIHEVRGERVILDSELSKLYGIETKNLKRQVRRNLSRFPSDFMIELTREEYDFLRCQNGTIESGRGEHSKYLPFAFTENGVAMLSSILNTDSAINVNIQIMRAFTSLRRAIYDLTQTTMRQDRLEFELKRLKDYVEDVLHDQNDLNEDLNAQMEALSMSMAELGGKVEALVANPKKIKPNPIGFHVNQD